MPMSTGGGLGSLVGTLLRAYLQGRGEREQEGQFRDAFTRLMNGMGGADAGPETRNPFQGGGNPSGPGTFAESDLGTDGAAGPAQAVRRTGGLLPQRPPTVLPAGYTDRTGPTQNTSSSPYFSPMPTQEPGLWGALKGAGSDLLSGLTPGDQYGTERSLAMLSLQEKLRAIYQQSQQEAMLRRMMGLEMFKRSLPPTEEQQAATDKNKALTSLYGTRQGQVGKAPPMNPLQQSEYDFEQQYGYKRPTGPGTATDKPGDASQRALTARILALQAGWAALDPSAQQNQLALVNQLIDNHNRAFPNTTMKRLAVQDVQVPGKLWGTNTEQRPMLEPGGAAAPAGGAPQGIPPLPKTITKASEAEAWYQQQGFSAAQAKQIVDRLVGGQ